MNTQPGKYKFQGKTAAHRRSIIRSQLQALIRTERVQTTTPRAKVLKAEFDRLITLAKKGTPTSERRVTEVLGSNLAAAKLHKVILPRLQEVNSGYTYSARTVSRKGDNAPQMIVMVRGAQIKKAKSRIQEALSRRGKATAKPAETPAEAEVERPKGRNRLQDAAQNLIPRRGGKKIDSTADTRRVST